MHIHMFMLHISLYIHNICRELNDKDPTQVLWWASCLPQLARIEPKACLHSNGMASTCSA